MRQEVYDGIFVGSKNECFMDEKEDWAVVHACKRPCHQKAVGYSGTLRNKNHKDYLDKEEEMHLYLNMVDSKTPKYFSDHLFDKAVEFISKHRDENRNILIHCSKGLSRAPSVVLVYLAREENVLNCSNYSSARDNFKANYYPRYRPNNGVKLFLQKNWDELT